MIHRRILDALRAQKWTAIAVELAIVVIGVFVGTLVANWNERRLEREESERLLTQIQPELQEFQSFFAGARDYYSITRSYADVAFGGWAGHNDVSDDQFVIAAYQASQVFGFGNNGEIWALIFGADQLRNVDDLKTRRALLRVMTINYADLDYRAVATPYREHIRQIIPVELQDAIRRECGDRTHPGKVAFLTLPRTCSVRLPGEQTAATAKRLRSIPELPDKLRWHMAAVATYLLIMEQYEAYVRNLSASIDAMD